MLWEQMSAFSPTPRENGALENLLMKLHHIYTIPKTEMSLKTIRQRQGGALKEMQTWNKTPDNPRVIKTKVPGLLLIEKVDTN